MTESHPAPRRWILTTNGGIAPDLPKLDLLSAHANARLRRFILPRDRF